MDHQAITTILVSQYKAALNMLQQAIERVSEDHWNTEEYKNPNWQIAYHTLWSTKFYLSADPESFVSWKNAIAGAESLGGSADWENPEEGVTVTGFHTKEDLLNFIADIENSLANAVAALPLEQYSGFDWYPYSRLEFHINNIRHIQHHAAGMIERLKIKGITGFPWAIDGNPPQEW